jgi:transcription elongation factor Elf1
MSQSQLIILFVTFLLASLVVVPLVLVTIKNERKKKREEVQKIKRSIAREEAKVHALEEKARSEALLKQKARLIHDFQEVNHQFRDLIQSLYPSYSCPTCASKVVKLVDFDPKNGEMTLSCGKCGSKRKTLPKNPTTYAETISQLTPALNAYHRVHDLVPNLPDLLFFI